jgi:hypothetical protein
MDLVDDASCALAQELVVEGEGTSGHEVGGLNSAQNDDLSVDALVTHDTDGLAGIEGSVSLRNLVIQTGFADHGDENVIRLSGDVDALGCNFTEDPAVALVLEKLR